MYPLPSRLAHWVTALLTVLAFSLVWLREDLPKGDLRSDMLVWHQWAGLLVLALLVPRLLARWLAGVLPLSDLPLWQRIIARATETGLYLLMIVQPLAGWLTASLKGNPVSLFGAVLPALAGPDRALAKQVEGLHEVGGTLILVLVGLHVLGALYHHFWRRDGVLISMIGGRPRTAAGT
jgi:cytochrome b561